MEQSKTTISKIKYNYKDENSSNTLESVIADLRKREEKGLKEYGTTVDRKDLILKDWIKEAYEEALDLAVYLRRAMDDIQ
jgi:hypothetical protein|tara:strand:+ start:14123 stop:14362 length:240 start_codon:yes stop_codon:yes gene_type:complete